MATVDQLRSYLVENFGATVHGNGGLSCSLEFTGGREHVVYFTLPSDGDARPDHVLVAAPFAKVGSISQEDAIEVVSYQTIGGLQRVNGFYCIANTLFLEDLDESEIRNSILVVANVADIYEEELGQGDAL